MEIHFLFVLSFLNLFFLIMSFFYFKNTRYDQSILKKIDFKIDTFFQTLDKYYPDLDKTIIRLHKVIRLYKNLKKEQTKRQKKLFQQKREPASSTKQTALREELKLSSKIQKSSVRNQEELSFICSFLEQNLNPVQEENPVLKTRDLKKAKNKNLQKLGSYIEQEKPEDFIQKNTSLSLQEIHFYKRIMKNNKK